MGNSDPQNMDVEWPAPDDLPGICKSGMAPTKNRISKSDTKQVINNTEEKTNLQEEKAEKTEDSKQNSK
jgi:hypothetical protein